MPNRFANPNHEVEPLTEEMDVKSDTQADAITIDGEAHSNHQSANTLSQSDCGQSVHLTTRQDSQDRVWDDVVHAIREDLRAFWGLWVTVIAPRLGEGIPTKYQDAKEWKVDNIDTVLVVFRLRCLTRQVEAITETWVPNTSIEKRVLTCVKFLFTLLNCPKREDKDNLRLFVRDILTNVDIEDFVYPLPVD